MTSDVLESVDRTVQASEILPGDFAIMCGWSWQVEDVRVSGTDVCFEVSRPSFPSEYKAELHFDASEMIVVKGDKLSEAEAQAEDASDAEVES